MPNEVVVSVDQDGNIMFLSSPTTKKMFPSASDTHRASHVEPENLLLRAAFSSLRRYLKDDSKLADWTRTWECSWRVNLWPVGGPILGPYDNRQVAIEEEIEWLHEYFL